MSALARTALRTAVRGTPRRATRGYSSAVAESEIPGLSNYLGEQKALQHHAAETSDMWRKISFYVCFPAIATCAAWVYNAEAEHAAHIEHIREENGGVLPENPEYPYLNKRVKPFPWGMNSLFYNPHTNKDMSQAM